MLPFDATKHIVALKLLPQDKHNQYMQHLKQQIDNWLSQLIQQPIMDNVVFDLRDHILLHLKPIFEQSESRWIDTREIMDVRLRTTIIGVDYVNRFYFYISNMVEGNKKLIYQWEPS